MPEEELENLFATFNGLIEGEDDLGDILFGEFEDFKRRVEGLKDGKGQIYTDALQSEEYEVCILDPEKTK